MVISYNRLRHLHASPTAAGLDEDRPSLHQAVGRVLGEDLLLGSPALTGRLGGVPEVLALPGDVEDDLVTGDRDVHLPAEDLGPLVVGAGDEGEKDDDHVLVSFAGLVYHHRLPTHGKGGDPGSPPPNPQPSVGASGAGSTSGTGSVLGFRGRLRTASGRVRPAVRMAFLAA